MTGRQPQFQFNLRAKSYTFYPAIVGKVHVTCWSDPKDSHETSSRRNEAKTRKVRKRERELYSRVQISEEMVSLKSR